MVEILKSEAPKKQYGFVLWHKFEYFTNNFSYDWSYADMQSISLASYNVIILANNTS